VVMGVAGSGKTTVGRLLAARLGVPFVDADDYHSASAVARMHAGRPLDDTMRELWLARVNDALRGLSGGFVLACSALKRVYRDTLRAANDGLVFVDLDVSVDVLRARLVARRGHFAGAELLSSQLATLELGDDIVTVAADGPPEIVVAHVLEAVAPTVP
jgi:gluconokinase